MFGRNALVVDDSLTARTVLKHQLNRFDVVVESASDGSHALELLKSHTPDVIFLDHIMPGLDGFQVLQLLKKNQFTKSIPVVMYTSQAAPDYTRQAKSLGAIAVISKKVTDEQLMEALDKAELYHLRAINGDQTTATDSDEAISGALGDASATQATAARWSSSNPVATPRASHAFAAVDQPSVALGSEANVESEQVGATPLLVNSQQLPSPMRGWLVALLLGVLVFAQGYGIMRDSEQQQTFNNLRQQLLQQQQTNNDLRQQVRLQQQIFPEMQAQLMSEQHRLAESTWRQMEFLMNILMSQVQGKSKQEESVPQ